MKAQLFSERLRTYRREQGLSQQEMANKLGVSANYVGMLENGREPGDTLEKLFGLIVERTTPTIEDPKVVFDAGRSDSPLDAMREARKRKGLSFADLAKITKYKADVLQAIEDGRGKASEKMIEAIASALQLDKERLFDGQIAEANVGTGTYGAKPNIDSHGAGTPRYIPLISMAQAGALDCNAFDDGAYQYEGTLAFDVKDNKAFGVTIIGESMQPVFGPGDVAIVYPQSTPHSGDHVIARLSETIGDQVLFKIYTPKGRDSLILSSYNPAFQPVEVSREDITWIYPVVSVMKKLRGK